MKLSQNRSKILIIYCGALNISKAEDLHAWLAEMSELHILAEIEIKMFDLNPTTETTPDTWLKLARLIFENYEGYEGFVVLHGIDNILYTASALSFLLQNLTKPIIFTGGNFISRSLEKPFLGSGREIGIKANIINAIQAATFPIHEVALMFGNKLLRANQSYFVNVGGLNFFEAPETAVLGRIDFSIRVYEKNILHNKGYLKFFDRLETHVFQYAYTPTVEWSRLGEILKNFRGVIIDLGELRSIPERVERFMSDLMKTTIVGVRLKPAYKLQLPKENAIVLSPFTPEAGFAKFMWALGQAQDGREAKKLMDKDIAGEFL